MASTNVKTVKPYSTQWAVDCISWWGHVLVGKHAHWCDEWDELPIDETCKEWPCGCRLDPEE